MPFSKKYETYTRQELEILFRAAYAPDPIELPFGNSQDASYFRSRMYGLRHAVGLAATERERKKCAEHELPERLRHKIISSYHLIARVTIRLEGSTVSMGPEMMRDSVEDVLHAALERLDTSTNPEQREFEERTVKDRLAEAAKESSAEAALGLPPSQEVLDIMKGIKGDG